jgi:hypothetical protein
MTDAMWLTCWFGCARLWHLNCSTTWGQLFYDPIHASRILLQERNYVMFDKFFSQVWWHRWWDSSIRLGFTIGLYSVMYRILQWNERKWNYFSHFMKNCHSNIKASQSCGLSHNLCFPFNDQPNFHFDQVRNSDFIYRVPFLFWIYIDNINNVLHILSQIVGKWRTLTRSVQKMIFPFSNQPGPRQSARLFVYKSRDWTLLRVSTRSLNIF